MPIYQITDSQSGRKIKVRGDSPPTDDEVVQILAKIPTKEINREEVTIPTGEPVSPELKGPVKEAYEPERLKLGSVIEPALTLASGMVAEPIAGLAGIATLPMGVEKAYDTIQNVRGDLTYIPKTPEGQRGLELLGEKLEPIGNILTKTEKTLGQKGYNLAGPIGGAIGETLPTLGLLALSSPQVRNIIGTKNVINAGKRLITPNAKKILAKSAPTIEGLKDAARGIYDELDNSGVVISTDSISNLRRQLNITALNEGFTKSGQPKIAALLNEFNAVRYTPQPLSKIDTLRKVANNARISLDPSEARMGNILTDHIDDFLDNIKPKDLIVGKAENVGTKYKDARQLWQRVKKSDLLTTAFERARNQASGFENGLRIQFRAILNNPKQIKGFTPDEITAMQKVVRGGPVENIAKALGKFGFTEGQASSMLLGAIGVFAGHSIGGRTGAVAIPVIGQVSKSLAQKLTRNNAEMAEAIIRAGKNGRQVVNAYLMSTPAKQRNVNELTELLMRPEINLKSIKGIKLPDNEYLIQDAVYFADLLQQKQKE